MTEWAVIASGIASGVLSNMTGYLVTGRLFHRFQRQTPQTWRQSESWLNYASSAGTRLLACVAIALLYARLHPVAPSSAPAAAIRGIGFGTLLWVASILPVILELALFVNWDRRFVVGLLLDWYILVLLASAGSAIAGTLG